MKGSGESLDRRMQPDHRNRYALRMAADARRYAFN